MAEAEQEMLYLNPLKLEAQWFLETLRTVNKSCKQADPQLLDLLIQITSEIGTYANQDVGHVLSTENTKMVAEHELKCIKRTFMCSICNYKHLGNSIGQAVIHLAKEHPITEKEMLQKKKENKEKDGRLKQIKTELPKKGKSLLDIQDKMNFYLEKVGVGDKLKQLPKYDVIEKDLQDDLKPVFQKKSVRIYMFGSRISGLGTRVSDLDIFIDIDSHFNMLENRPSPQIINNLKIVRKTLRSDRKWKVGTCIENARVPIIKVTHKSSGIECDIGFSNSLGYCNTKLVEYVVQYQPIARCLCIFLKIWLERIKLDEQITSYSITLMVIYFLQVNKLLPSIEQMQLDLKKPLNVGPWLANFAQKALSDYKIDAVDVTGKNINKYLMDFFSFYANFNFDTYVICPYFGIQNIEIKNIEKAMPERYTEFVQTNQNPGLQLKKPMIVQDPLELNHNVTKSITIFILSQFIEYCKQSAELLQNLTK